jgi:hypothetical protein
MMIPKIKPPRKTLEEIITEGQDKFRTMPPQPQPLDEPVRIGGGGPIVFAVVLLAVVLLLFLAVRFVGVQP